MFAVIGILALVGLVQELLAFVHLHQFNNMLESSESMIGGADKATSIFVSNISIQGFTAIMTVIAGIVAVVGLYHTRRK